MDTGHSVYDILLRGEQSYHENSTPDTVNLPTKRDGRVDPEKVNETGVGEVKNGANAIEVGESEKVAKVTKKRKTKQEVCVDPEKVKETVADAVINGENGIEAGKKKPKKSRNDVTDKKDAPLAKRTSRRKLQTSSEVANQAELKVGGDITKEGRPETLKNKKRKAADTEITNGNSVSHAEISLPLGEELTTVAGIEVPSQDVGNALQLSEFCAVFGEIIKVKKARAEHVLQDIFHGRTGRRGKISTTVQFHMDLLSMIKKDQGEKFAELTMFGRTSWFNQLKEFLSESKGVLKTHGLEFLDKLADYETLDASQKLRLLNVLCDEVLGLEMVRNWIDEQNEEFADRVKEAKEKLRAANEEENGLKMQLVNDITARIVANNGTALSIEEHSAIVYRAKAEMETAHARVLESKGLIMNCNQYPEAVRAESILVNQDHAYWKLNISGKANLLCQKIGKGDNTDTLDEKWSVIDTDGKDVIEKHAHSLRKQRGAEQRAQRKAMKEHKKRKEEVDSAALPE